MTRRPSRLAPPMSAADRAARWRGLGIIFVASFMFGAMAVCVRVASRTMPAPQIAFVRFAGALLLLLLAGRGQSLWPRSGRFGGVLLRGLLGAFAILLYFQGIRGAGAGFATLLHCTYPVYTALFATLLFGEAFTAVLGGALALSLTGAVVVLGPVARTGDPTLWGGLCALAASVLAGGAVATARHLRARESAWLITTYFMAVGVVCSAPGLWSGLPPVSAELILALVGTVLTSVAGQLLLHEGLGFTSAAEGSITAATAVVSAAVLEAVFLHEPMRGTTLAGAALLLVAVLLAASSRR